MIRNNNNIANTSANNQGPRNDRNAMRTLLALSFLFGCFAAQASAPKIETMLANKNAVVSTERYEDRLIVKNDCPRTIVVFVDGVEFGEVASHSEQRFVVLAGEHDLEAKELDRQHSKGTSHVTLTDNERFKWTIYQG